MTRVALVTCQELAGLDGDDQLLVQPLKEHGAEAVPVVWDDPQVDWTTFDLAVLRSPWDYAPRRAEFLAWAQSVPKLLNPPDVVRWNTDKRYLHDLETAGAPVVATRWIEPGDPVALPGDDALPGDGRPESILSQAEEYVIKPSVSAGSIDTGRYVVGDPAHAVLARQHVARLTDRGATVMIQPYLSAVDAFGETAMLFVDGEFSHAIRKGPLLDGPDYGEKGLFRPEDITPRMPSDEEHKVAELVLASVPSVRDLLYARVDLIPGADGSPILLELELTEPSMFLGHGAGAAHRFAAAMAARI